MKQIGTVLISLLILLNSSFSTCWASKSDNKLKLLAFSGSSRTDSYNKKALLLLIDAVKKEGVTVTYIDLADFPIPLYNGDLEARQGLPENVIKLQNLIAAHDGLLIASPEYNGFPSPLLINSIDWTTREEKGKSNSGINIYKGKIAALIATSPGNSGGSRGLSQLTQLLKNIGLKVVPKQTTIPNAIQAFNAQGDLNNAEFTQQITKQAKSIVQALKE